MRLLQGRRPSLAELTPSGPGSKHPSYIVPETLIAFAIAAISSTAAHAQQAPSPSVDDSNKPQMEEVVITGT